MPTHNDPSIHRIPEDDPERELGKAPGKDFYKVENKDKLALHSVGEGYELTDVSVHGIGVFLVALGITIGVFFVFSFGMGKIMNTVFRKADGPAGRWSETARQQVPTTGSTGKGRSMESNAALEQQQLHQITQAFPTPRLQTDDGDQDMADMHAREDLLLNNYSWADKSHDKVRIPIDRAMQLIAQRGLPVAPQTAPQSQALMYGDSVPTVQVPLTSGFARTGYEQERASPAHLPGDQASSKANNY